MKLRFLLFACLSFSCLQSQPLTVDQNQLAHKRYWYYRARFINDFTN
jgi:hypothetical protein